MTNQTRRALGGLFRSTSAFDTPVAPPPEPPPRSPVPDDDWKRVAGLIGDVLFLIDDNPEQTTPLVELIAQSLEELDRVVASHA